MKSHKSLFRKCTLSEMPTTFEFLEFIYKLQNYRNGIKSNENQSLMILEMSPIKFSNKFQWQLPTDLFNTNFSLTSLSF